MHRRPQSLVEGDLWSASPEDAEEESLEAFHSVVLEGPLSLPADANEPAPQLAGRSRSGVGAAGGGNDEVAALLSAFASHIGGPPRTLEFAASADCPQAPTSAPSDTARQCSSQPLLWKGDVVNRLRIGLNDGGELSRLVLLAQQTTSQRPASTRSRALVDTLRPTSWSSLVVDTRRAVAPTVSDLLRSTRRKKGFRSEENDPNASQQVPRKRCLDSATRENKGDGFAIEADQKAQINHEVPVALPSGNSLCKSSSAPALDWNSSFSSAAKGQGSSDGPGILGEVTATTLAPAGVRSRFDLVALFRSAHAQGTTATSDCAGSPRNTVVAPPPAPPQVASFSTLRHTSQPVPPPQHSTVFATVASGTPSTAATGRRFGTGGPMRQVQLPDCAAPIVPVRPDCIEGVRFGQLAEEPLTFWGVWFLVAAAVRFKRPLRRRAQALLAAERGAHLNALQTRMLAERPKVLAGDPAVVARAALYDALRRSAPEAFQRRRALERRFNARERSRVGGGRAPLRDGQQDPVGVETYTPSRPLAAAIVAKTSIEVGLPVAPAAAAAAAVLVPSRSLPESLWIPRLNYRAPTPPQRVSPRVQSARLAAATQRAIDSGRCRCDSARSLAAACRRSQRGSAPLAQPGSGETPMVSVASLPPCPVVLVERLAEYLDGVTDREQDKPFPTADAGRGGATAGHHGEPERDGAAAALTKRATTTRGSNAGTFAPGPTGEWVAQNNREGKETEAAASCAGVEGHSDEPLDWRLSIDSNSRRSIVGEGEDEDADSHSAALASSPSAAGRRGALATTLKFQQALVAGGIATGREAVAADLIDGAGHATESQRHLLSPRHTAVPLPHCSASGQEQPTRVSPRAGLVHGGGFFGRSGLGQQQSGDATESSLGASAKSGIGKTSNETSLLNYPHANVERDNAAGLGVGIGGCARSAGASRTGSSDRRTASRDGEGSGFLIAVPPVPVLRLHPTASYPPRPPPIPKEAAAAAKEKRSRRLLAQQLRRGNNAVPLRPRAPPGSPLVGGDPAVAALATTGCRSGLLTASVTAVPDADSPRRRHDHFLWQSRLDRSAYHQDVLQRLDAAARRREAALPLKRAFLFRELEPSVERTSPVVDRYARLAASGAKTTPMHAPSVNDVLKSARRFVADTRLVSQYRVHQTQREAWFFDFYQRVTDVNCSEGVGSVLARLQPSFVTAKRDASGSPPRDAAGQVKEGGDEGCHAGAPLTPEGFYRVVADIPDDELLCFEAQFVLRHAAEAYGVSFLAWRELLELRHVPYVLQG